MQRNVCFDGVVAIYLFIYYTFGAKGLTVWNGLNPEDDQAKLMRCSASAALLQCNVLILHLRH